MILTRKQLAEFDPSPLYAGVSEKRYLCPSEECKDKPHDNTHRSLTVRDDGVYQCFRCGMKGRLVTGKISESVERSMQGATMKLTKQTLKEMMS